jgi:hypothetical protein
MNIQQISRQLSQNHYCHARDFAKLISCEPGQADSFRAYWANLVRDEAFKDYTHRERRILRYRSLPGGQLQLDRNPEYSSSVTYPINYRKGVNVLSYAEEGFINHPLLQQILATDIAVVGARLGSHAYAIDVHQFRVKASGQVHSPTTSGIHQDGLDWVSMHFIDACNTKAVVSQVYTEQTPERCVLSLTMERFLETIVVHDRVVYHSAGSVQQVDGATPAWRDLLLVGFRCSPDSEEAQSTC